MATIKRQKTRAIREFGDFQTPLDLALAVMKVLRKIGVQPTAILEPTCGRGAFVSASACEYSGVPLILGVDINPNHLTLARETVLPHHSNVTLLQGDFFSLDWPAILARSDGPWLILGNPPWVTSSELGAIASHNLPVKSNFHGRVGIEAITGKSNFDISEWMILRYLEWLQDHRGYIAVLCKTAVARKILQHAWKARKNAIHTARIFKFDALSTFGAAVDACLFVLELRPNATGFSCDVFESFGASAPAYTMGFIEGHIVNNVAVFKQQQALYGPEDRYTWRSGVKHDCSKIMELASTGAGYKNGFGEDIELEESYLFPLLKSSDIGNGRLHCRNSMLVTQRAIGDDTSGIQSNAPQTWNYLQKHIASFEKRSSSIYRNKPPFSIFGVGQYTFSPWKVAISGFYKRLNFVKVGPVNGKPVVFDDTVYFLPCWSEEEADFLQRLLQSNTATAFFEAMIHWDEKRPITVEILKRLSLRKLAATAGCEAEYLRFSDRRELPLFTGVEAVKIA